MDQGEMPRDGQDGEGGQLLYLYCFARAGGHRGVAAPGLLESGVLTLDLDAVSAVFCLVPREEFEGEAAARNLQDLAWVAPRAIRHEAVIEEVMQASPVLPVRFGTVFLSRPALHDALRNHYGRIARFLADFSDKEEWSVKAFVNAATAAGWLVANDTGLGEQRMCSPESPGARYLQQQRLKAEAGRRFREACRQWGGQITKRLGELADDVRPLRLQPGELTNRTEDMLLNSAYLLRSSQVGSFRRSVDETALACADQGVILEASGPWPPYSFCPSIGDTTE